jgi:hypothetical protein
VSFLRGVWAGKLAYASIGVLTDIGVGGLDSNYLVGLES